LYKEEGKCYTRQDGTYYKCIVDTYCLTLNYDAYGKSTKELDEFKQRMKSKAADIFTGFPYLIGLSSFNVRDHKNDDGVVTGCIVDLEYIKLS
jgi:hypothetical protein